MSPEFYEHLIQVKPEHIDEMNHVNNVVYLQWAQDAAFAHWMAKASHAVREQYKWVVLNMRLNIKAQHF